ncbi:unnamed protein product [Prunus armeniaca]
MAEMAKLKHPISCKALTKPSKGQKPLPFTGGFIPNKPTQNKVYSFYLTKVDALFDEMLLHKAIKTLHRLPKPKELKGRQYCRWHNSWNHSTNSCVVFRDVIQEGITAGRLKLAEKPPSVTTDAFPQPQVNMVNLNWPEDRPKATISVGVVLCSKCKCESELEVTLDIQNQLTPSVSYRSGISYQHSPVPASSKDRARHKDYLRPAHCNRRMTEQPKNEIPIKMPGNEKPLATIIEGRWYSVGKSGRPTLELTKTQKRRVQRQYCTFLKNRGDTQVLPETSSTRRGKNPEVAPQAE